MRLRPVLEVAVPGLSAPIGGEKLVVIAGPCTLEALDLGLEIAGHMKAVCGRLGLPYIFKASFDKANRTSGRSPRGPGLETGLAWMAEIRARLQVPVLADVHETWQVEPAAAVVDVLQIPAFLCRQTDLLVAAGRSGRVVNIKKGQFLAPDDVAYAIQKVADTGNRAVFVTERGTVFGYHDLVVDLRGLVLLRDFGHPVIFDATHSVQRPGAAGGASGGQRRFVAALARAALAAGCDGLFIETHPNPAAAVSDGPNMVPLAQMQALLEQCVAIRAAVLEACDVPLESEEL
ncbi:MAG: 3-deoxy-8-phosphooctulonate synthase [Armatimonadetes bacterium]|nr:3-deoxy-8-phosphooctulonate synthase [Armatimonadota bacterium]